LAGGRIAFPEKKTHYGLFGPGEVLEMSYFCFDYVFWIIPGSVGENFYYLLILLGGYS